MMFTGEYKCIVRECLVFNNGICTLSFEFFKILFFKNKIDLKFQNEWLSLKDKVKKIIILEKMHHEVSGKGYKCQIERIDMNCSRSFFRVDTCLKSEWTPVKLEEKECWNMVNTQHCRIECKDFTYDKKSHSRV